MKVIYYSSFANCLGPVIRAVDNYYGPSLKIEQRGLNDKQYNFDSDSVVIGHGLGAYKAYNMTVNCGLMVTINLHKIINSEVYLNNHGGTHLNFISRLGFITGRRVEDAFNIELFDEGYFKICSSRTVIDFVIANMDELKRLS